MSEMERLRDVSHSPLERQVLAAASADEAPEGGKQRLLQTLGLTAAVTLGAAGGAAFVASKSAATTAVAGAGAGSAALGGATAAASASGLGVTLLVKWVGLGAVVGMVASGTAAFTAASSANDVARSTNDGARNTSAATAFDGVASSPPAALPAVQHTAEQVTAAAELDRAEDKPGAALPNVPRIETSTIEAASPPPDGPRIAPELALLDAARRALSSGQPSRALALLDERQREFGKGVLSPEALVVRCEALLAAGQRDSARTLGLAFLDEYPASPLVNRVRALLDRAARSRATEPSPALEAAPRTRQPSNVGTFGDE